MDKKARSDYWLFTKDREHTKNCRGWKRHDMKAISSKKATAMLITVNVTLRQSSTRNKKGHFKMK